MHEESPAVKCLQVHLDGEDFISWNVKLSRRTQGVNDETHLRHPRFPRAKAPARCLQPISGFGSSLTGGG
jgi:hypothetical protein